MSITVATNSKGEIVDVQAVNQFQFRNGLALTQFACGYFCCAEAASMARPGQPPTQSANQVIAEALQWYRDFNGSDAVTNTAGMTDEQLWRLLAQIKLHFQHTSNEASILKQWLRVGYPVICHVIETSVYDLTLKRNPYPWTPSGTHLILLTGIDGQGNFLVRDSANVGNINDPTSLRPGPRSYDAARLIVVSATVVVPPWYPRPASANPPTKPPVQADPNLKVPEGWTYDGEVLIAKNGKKVRYGFCYYVLTHPWNPDDVPLAEEVGADPVEMGYSDPGGDNKGTRQIFLYTMLGWTSKRGVFKITVGRELATALQQLAAATPPPASTTTPTTTEQA